MLNRLLAPIASSMLALATCLSCGCLIVVEDTSDYDDYPMMIAEDDKPRIGINTDRVSPALAAQLGVKADRATLVSSVYAGWPADRAGVRQFDVITKIDGSDDASPDAVLNAIRGKNPGETVALTVIRNAQAIDLTVTTEAHGPQ